MIKKTKMMPIAVLLMIIGGITFAGSLLTGHPDIAWRAYLINFLLFSAIAQGAVLFSAMMNTVGAKWSGRLAGLAEAFVAFFPVSFVLFLGLFFGRNEVFPWLHHDLHGKEAWLNISFLFTRDVIGFLVLYGIGFAYLYYALWFKIGNSDSTTGLNRKLTGWWASRAPDPQVYTHRRYVFGVLYLLAFAIVLSLIGYDLVMAAEPHWYSTLFGAYCFVKAIYVGFGALIILAAYLHLNRNISFNVSSAEFHDMGKLFFAFCLVWADFFYCQLVVIWYGNISEEAAYIITRTMVTPWKGMAWTVFIICFLLPFFILLNRKIKTFPRAMLSLCLLVIAGMWLEHYLLLAPALHHQPGHMPLSAYEILIALGFGGLLIFTVFGFLNQFPEMLASTGETVVNESIT